VTKVVVIGNGGGGKTVLSRQLATSHDLPMHEVDEIQWRQPGWQPVAQELVRERIEAVIESPRWLIDGWGPWDTIDRRITEADTVVVIDMPLWRHYLWASKRALRDRRYPRFRLYRTMWQVHRQAMPMVRERIAREPTGKVWQLRSPRSIRTFTATTARAR
jgi:adenylate kinase family enzyme